VKSKSNWMTDKNGMYLSVGIGGAITGRGANIFIIDDPIKNREEAESPTFREKTWDWYRSVAYTRLEKDGAVVLILTRWHFDDLAGRLLEAMREDGDKWEIVSFPAIAEEDEEFRKKGESLWPAKFDLDALEQKKRVVGLMEWSAVYQQTPLISETQEFKDNYFRYFEESELEKKNLFIDILIDPAVSQKDKACNTGIIVAAHETTDTKIWILDDLSGKYDPYEITELIFFHVEQLEQTYLMSHIRVWIETEAMQKVFTYIFHKEMKVRRKFFTLNELKSGHSENAKDIRIRGLIPLYRGGQVFHRPRMKKGELELELTQFPVGKLKDRIDALSYKVQLLRPPVLKKKKHAPVMATNSLTGW
jgi:hypothetical protein